MTQDRVNVMTSPFHSSREMTPDLENRVSVMTSPFHSSREMTPSIENRVMTPPKHFQYSKLIVPLGVTTAYTTYQIYNRLKRNRMPKRNMTMSVMEHRY